MDTYKNKSLEDLKNEEWRSIEGFDGLYEVSNMGRVKSLRRWIQRIDGTGYWSQEKILSQSVASKCKRTGNKSLAVTLRLDGVSHNKSVASLVLSAFQKAPKHSYITHHINGDSSDNRLVNLTFEDPSMKQKFEFENGVRSKEVAKRVWLERMLDGDLKEKWKQGNPDIVAIKKNRSFQKRKQYPVTVYIRSKGSMATFSSIKNASENTGIPEKTLRNALFIPRENPEIQVKKGQFVTKEQFDSAGEL